MSTTITTEGNLTADPELRYTKTTGQAVCTIRLAVSSRRKNIDGEYEDTPAIFYEATTWGALAEHLADSAHKGDRVIVHGSTHDEEWTDREGMTRIKHALQVTSLRRGQFHSPLGEQWAQVGGGEHVPRGHQLA